MKNPYNEFIQYREWKTQNGNYNQKRKTPLEPPRTLRKMNGSDSSNPNSDIRVPGELSKLIEVNMTLPCDWNDTVLHLRMKEIMKWKLTKEGKEFHSWRIERLSREILSLLERERTVFVCPQNSETFWFGLREIVKRR